MYNNPVTYALQQVRYDIPREILEKTFISMAGRQGQAGVLNRHTQVSLDARIREEVLEARVLEDCNLYGGRELQIPLAGLPRDNVDMYSAVFRIPKALTNGGTITRALSVHYQLPPTQGAPIVGPQTIGGSQVLDNANSLLMSHSNIPAISSANVQVVAENAVHVMLISPITENLLLRCWVSNDEELSHLMPATYGLFAEMVIWAVKAYIYNNMSITLDRGYVAGGAELGRFKEIVEEYRDANENYKALVRKKWPKAVILNDQQTKVRHIRQLVGGRR